MIKHITKDNVSEIEKGKILLDFWAEWCAPCRALSTTLNALENDINVGKINADEENDLVSEFGIRQLPTLILLENGKVLKRTSGSMSKEQLLKFYNEEVPQKLS